ncbi:Uncharacterised protein [Legionella pneumophila subsp. pascullei]|uniref:Uncharacterized protein n=1 Tax=Legionella pneumophila subsp. pascullei TaxID=91890 RepID=A0AAX2IYB8_LEGPN|nr:Uncharacterised protein [Legionella pneumophila subsp. pascullei]VEH07715.1 Uncharacterised protein [Legionella pneumophila subsp. pascullei]
MDIIAASSLFACKRESQTKISKKHKVLFATLKKLHGTKGTSGSPALGLGYSRPHLKLPTWGIGDILDLVIIINDHKVKLFPSVCYRYFVSFDKTLDIDF